MLFTVGPRAFHRREGLFLVSGWIRRPGYSHEGGRVPRAADVSVVKDQVRGCHKNVTGCGKKVKVGGEGEANLHLNYQDRGEDCPHWRKVIENSEN